MNVLVAVLVVGAGSLAFRLLPLLAANRVPEAVARTAGWAGVSVLAAITVRTVLHHHDPTVPVPTLVGGLAVGACLLAVARGRHLLVGVVTGAVVYALLGAAARLLWS